jgi:hypothetical protein
MRLMHLPKIVTAAALLGSLAAVPSADAASNGTYLYDVTVKAEMKDQWSFRDEGEIGTPWSPCHVARVGEGSASWQLHSRRPTRVMVMKGFGGRPPSLNVGTGEGIPLTGAYKRAGSDVETHTGAGTCETGNPPQIQDTSGCGTKTAGFDWNLAWKDNKRGRVYPSAVPSEPSGDCPSGPPWALDWKNDESPSLMDASTAASASKFLGTKQFTISGSKTFTGTVPTATGRSGTQTVTWSWTTTYRKVRAKKQRRRR